MIHHDFRRFLDALDDLNSAQIENAQMKIRDLRRQMEAISEIEARTNQGHKCPFCDDERRQKWGRTQTNVQRYCWTGCQKTYSGRTGVTPQWWHRTKHQRLVLESRNANQLLSRPLCPTSDGGWANLFYRCGAQGLCHNDVCLFHLC